MARIYRLGFARWLANAAVQLAVGIGLAPERYWLLTVRGRASGAPRSTPVIVHARGAERWLVSPYGERAWVRNARAAGRVRLSRGGRRETLAVEEVDAEAAAPILKEYLRETPITRPFFDVTPDSSLADFVREAARHPVFRLRPLASPAP